MGGMATLWAQTMSDFTATPYARPCSRQELSVHVPVAARGLSIVLSNRYGIEPLVIEGVELACGAARTPLAFRGERRCTLEPGAHTVSDVVAVPTDGRAPLLVRLDPAPGQVAVTLGSSASSALVEVREPGPLGDMNVYWGLEAVLGQGAVPARTVSFFGDSLTNQARYTAEATRLLAAALPGTVTLNCGISGNRLLRDSAVSERWGRSFGAAARSRFAADITFGGAVVPDVVFALIGVNDLYQAGGCAPAEELPAPGELERGYRELASSSARLGCTLLIGTIPPFKGAVGHGLSAWTPGKERLRREANAFIRSLPHSVDVDAAVRDPSDPCRLAAPCDSGDHLHFNAEAGRRVGETVAAALIAVCKGGAG